MTPLLMPDPKEAAEAGLTADYPTYRRWWSVNVLKLPQRRSSKRKPEPGVIDLADEEVG